MSTEHLMPDSLDATVFTTLSILMARKQLAVSSETNDEPQTPTTGALRRETRVLTIARALASSATVTEIAKAENIGRTWASKHANSLACRQLIMEFVNE